MHDESLRDDIAALAVGALPPAEAEALRAHAAGCALCASEYRDALLAVDLLVACAEADSVTGPVPDADGLRERTFAAARTARAPRTRGYATVVSPDALVPLADGVEWAVLPVPGMTLVYWVFTPPACTKLPLESHAQAQAGFVVDGALEFHYGDGSRRVVRRDGMYAIEPHTVHGATILEKTILVDVYTPNMAEFERRYAEQRARLRSG